MAPSTQGAPTAAYLVSTGEHLAENTSTTDADGQAVGPMTDDVDLEECYDLRPAVQVVGITVTNSTATPERYRVSVSARDAGGAVVGTLHASSHQVAPGASELIAARAPVSAPVALCVVSRVSRL